MATVVENRGGDFTNNARNTAIVLGIVLFLSAFLPMPDDRGRILGLPSICPFYEMTGLPCPGCGLTRSFVCFAHGQILTAFRWNLLGPALWLAAAFLLTRAVATLIKREQILPFSPAFSRQVSWGLVIALLLFGVSRIAYLTVTHQRF